MTELKTLRDFSWNSPMLFLHVNSLWNSLWESGAEISPHIKPIDDAFVSSTNLRQEAIRWFKKRYNAVPHEFGFNCDIGGIIFAEFFDITEEDLE